MFLAIHLTYHCTHWFHHTHVFGWYTAGCPRISTSHSVYSFCMFLAIHLIHHCIQESVTHHKQVIHLCILFCQHISICPWCSSSTHSCLHLTCHCRQNQWLHHTPLPQGCTLCCQHISTGSLDSQQYCGSWWWLQIRTEQHQQTWKTSICRTIKSKAFFHWKTFEFCIGDVLTSQMIDLQCVAWNAYQPKPCMIQIKSFVHLATGFSILLLSQRRLHVSNWTIFLCLLLFLFSQNSEKETNQALFCLKNDKLCDERECPAFQIKTKIDLPVNCEMVVRTIVESKMVWFISHKFTA